MAAAASGPITVVLHELSHAGAAWATGGVVLSVALHLDHGAVAFRSPWPAVVFLAGPLGAVGLACALAWLESVRLPAAVVATRAALEATRAALLGSDASDIAVATTLLPLSRAALVSLLLTSVWAITGVTLWRRVFGIRPG